MVDIAINGHAAPIATQRRDRALALRDQGYGLVKIAEMIAASGILNPDTGLPYSTSTIRRDLDSTRPDGDVLSTISEMIGRSERTPFWQQYKTLYTVDPHRTDYEWYDKFRNCLQPGFELAGLFARPIAEILAFYTLGDDPLFTLAVNDLDDDDDQVDDDTRLYTNRKIKRWVSNHIGELLNMLVEDYSLGDQFVFMNDDGSLTIPSPDTVKIIRNLANPNQILEAIIYTRFEGALIEEHISATKRTRIISIHGQEPVTLEYDNLLGVIPLVIFSCDKRGNELYGRPIYEALIKSLLFQHYTELITKAVEGYRVLGNPIPTFSKVENIQATLDANAPATPTTYEDGYGTSVTRNEIAFDANGAVVTSGEFSMVTPPVGFSEDMRKILKALFLIICDYTRIPEWMWGGAVEASKASTETQMPPFVSYITGKRVQLDGTPGKQDGMRDLIQLYLRVARLVDPRIHVGDVQSQYQDVSKEEDQVRLQKLIYAHGNQMLDRVKTLTALRVSQDPVKDVKEAVAEADADMKKQQEQDEFMTALNDAAHRELDPEAQVQRPEGGDSAA